MRFDPNDPLDAALREAMLVPVPPGLAARAAGVASRPTIPPAVAPRWFWRPLAAAAALAAVLGLAGFFFSWDTEAFAVSLPDAPSLLAAAEDEAPVVPLPSMPAGWAVASAVAGLAFVRFGAKS